jgi:allantoin racemase
LILTEYEVIALKIMVINPNTTAAMTQQMVETCSKLVGPEVELRVCNPTKGVPSIQGRADGIAAAYYTLELIRKADKEGVDGFVIACFDDTGLQAAREVAGGPVVGIGEAAMSAASMLGAKYSILTSTQRSVQILEENADNYGLSKRCQGIHALNIPVLDLHSESSYGLALERSRKIVEQDHAECLVMGCGGMTHWQEPLSNDLGMPVIDGVVVGLGLVEILVRMNLKTSKAITYAYPIEE